MKAIRSKQLFAGLAVACLVLLGPASSVLAKTVTTKAIIKKDLVAVEPVWSSIAKMLVDEKYWNTSSLLHGNTDPHDFSPSPVMLKSLHNSNLAIVNGGGYDNWAKSKASSAHLLVVSTLASKGERDPHYFLDPNIVELAANKIHVALLVQTRKASQSSLLQKKAAFNKHMLLLKDKILRLKKKASGTAIAVTELAGSKLLQEAGFVITDLDLALSITDGRDISPQAQARLESDIKNHKIAFFVVNPTHSGGVGKYLEDVASKSDLPIVKIPESMPEGVDWLHWINSIVDDAGAAFADSQLASTATAAK